MKQRSPKLEEWRRLYEAAVEVKKRAPWEWMSESQIFAVRNPGSEDLAFVSVMGMAGEHFAVAAYLGARGLHGFLDLAQSPPLGDADRVLEIPQLQASFEDRKTLHKDDVAVLRKLGLRFRGRNAWPMFRSYQPALAPWFLTWTEAKLLTHVLEQLLVLAPRVQDEPDLLDPQENGRLLLREPSRKTGGLVWTDAVLDEPPPEPIQLKLSVDREMMGRIKRAARAVERVEADLFMLPAIQEKKGQRPFYPYALLLVDEHSGMVLGFEMLAPEPSLESIWERIPQTLLEQLAALGVRPKEIRIRSPLLAQLLAALAQALGIRLVFNDRLPSLEAARDAMLRHLL